MTITFNWWFVLFTSSFLLNLFLIWYVAAFIRTLRFLTDNINIFVETFEDFSEHLSSIYEMEMYYGDQTLEELIKHATMVQNTFEEFGEILELYEEDIEEDQELLEERTENAETPQDSQIEAQSEVFYAGSRRRNN